MSTRNNSLGGKSCRCLGLKILSPSCASTLWNPKGLFRGCFTFNFHVPSPTPEIFRSSRLIAPPTYQSNLIGPTSRFLYSRFICTEHSSDTKIMGPTKVPETSVDRNHLAPRSTPEAPNSTKWLLHVQQSWEGDFKLAFLPTYHVYPHSSRPTTEQGLFHTFIE